MFAHGSSKCTLVWQLPENCHRWDNVGTVKLLMSIRIYSQSGKLLGEEFAKYIGKFEMFFSAAGAFSVVCLLSGNDESVE